jgi:hypothetical protein
VLAPEPWAEAARTILTLTFGNRSSEVRVYSRSHCFRLCADGTMRSGDNSVAAARVPGGWRVGGKVFRDFDCDGPVLLIVRRAAPAASARYGPYGGIRTFNGQLFAGDVGIDVFLPTQGAIPAPAWHEALLLPAPPSA